MGYNDVDAAGHYDRALCYWYNGDAVFAFSGVFSKEAYAKIHTISGKSASRSNFWHAGGVLPERCFDPVRQSWPA